MGDYNMVNGGRGNYDFYYWGGDLYGDRKK